jgi:D-serine dehydratase
MDAVTYMRERKPFLWINPNKLNSEQSLHKQNLGLYDIKDAEERLIRFAPLLVKLFPELGSSNGIIDSALSKIYNMSFNTDKLCIKEDHSLPVSGSIKARGGFYAVFVIVEKILSEHKLSVTNIINKPFGDIRSLFTSRSLVVGSTGNLGLSIGLMGRAFGFGVTVHMSQDAKEWKKENLKNIGVTVIEHESDYSEACKAARASAKNNSGIYFIDDENSKDLFLGYSTAASMLTRQLKQKNIIINSEHPIFVYIPCGVGGAPGGITFGLKHIFGDDVHCFFAEPVEAPAMMFGLVTGKNSFVSVKDIGLGKSTCADGLAVGVPSELVSEMMNTLLDGCFTVEDESMLKYLAQLYDAEGIKVEPSAAAGFAGPDYILNSKAGKLYLSRNKIIANSITHIVWTTGGSMEPEEEFQNNYRLLFS